ncbi:MAG: 50S ribosomal protein L9 [Myxococcota bacterium]
MMKVILKEDVQNLGVIGDLVRVRDGYGRNFLIPQGKAVLASARSVKELEHQKRIAAHNREKAKGVAGVHKTKIESLSIVLSAKVAHQAGVVEAADTLQKLFGSITGKDLAKVFEAAGIALDHRRISLSDRVHTVGKYSAKIRLDGGIVAQVPFWVIPEGAPDIDAEKKRVEAAQAAHKKAEEERIAAEKAKLAAAAALPKPKAEKPAEATETAEASSES